MDYGCESSFYPLVMTNIAMDNGHVQWIFPLKVMICHSYVELPEGKFLDLSTTKFGIDPLLSIIYQIVIFDKLELIHYQFWTCPERMECVQ